ncbi:MAG: ABC transporter permease [Chloroflexi bacterium HGW-Chloroflexi-10]|nr:MAG: ABC transporter permease [Chloroflexi bacterium HGW-Chloroflexi-10]
MIQAFALQKLLKIQIRLYLREPITVFFTMFLAPLMLIMMGFVTGNEPQEMFGGRGQLDVYLPTYTALVIGIVGLISVPIETTSRREIGALRRFRATPLKPLTYILSDVLINFVLILMGITLLLVLGLTVYRIRFEGRFLSLAFALCLSSAAFLAIGYVLASVLPNNRVATLVGNLLLYPMMFFSGATVPREMLPEAIQKLSYALPLTHVVSLVKGAWFGEPLGQYWVEIVVLGAILVVCTLISTRAFRWE